MTDQSEQAIDQHLINELRNPGSDQRCGVNIVARPATSIRDQILHVQDCLRVVEPDQYYYPSSDLHLTVLEICSGAELSFASQMFDQVCKVAPTIFSTLVLLELRDASLRFDRHAGIVLFQGIGSLNEVREEMRARFANQGIALSPRYDLNSAHVTFMRYLRKLTGSWKELVSSQQIEGNWQLNELWVTCGANWYGMKSRIKAVGPFKFNGASLSAT